MFWLFVTVYRYLNFLRGYWHSFPVIPYAPSLSFAPICVSLLSLSRLVLLSTRKCDTSLTLLICSVIPSPMLTYSKSWRSIRSRTGSLYSRARTKLTASFRASSPRHLSPNTADDSVSSEKIQIIIVCTHERPNYESECLLADYWVTPLSLGWLVTHTGKRAVALGERLSMPHKSET